MTVNERIEAWFAGREDEYVSALAPLIAIDSTTGAPEPGKPFGPGPAMALDAALELARKWGLTTGEDENGKVIVNIENVAFDNVSILVDPWFLNIKNIEYSLFARELKDVSIKNVKASISFVIDTLRKNDGHTFLEAEGKYFTSQENASVVGCDFGEFKYYVTEMTGDGKEVLVPSDMEGNKL